MFNISKRRIILLILFFCITGFFLFFWKKFHSEHKIDINHQTNATKYEEIIKKIDIKNINSLNEAETFITQNQNIYGTLTALSLSKKYILQNKLDQALMILNNSLKYTIEENLKTILELNIVKIQTEQQNYQNALKMLKNIQNHNWSNIVENMKGDIFMHLKNPKKAIQSWKKSLLSENSNASKEILHMKINDLQE